MTVVYPLQRLGAREVKALSKEPHRDLVAYPTYWWPTVGGYKLWPNPPDNVEIVFDRNGDPRGFFVKGYRTVKNAPPRKNVLDGWDGATKVKGVDYALPPPPNHRPRSPLGSWLANLWAGITSGRS